MVKNLTYFQTETQTVKEEDNLINQSQPLKQVSP